MAKIRINPDIIDNYGNNIKGQAGHVLQRAESVNHAVMNAPSYNGQFGPKVRAIGASAHSAGRQHTERLSNQGQNLCSIGAHFRSVDMLQLYASGAYREFFSPDTESWFERKIREFRIHLTQRIQKNEEKLENLRKDEIWYSNEIASVLDKIAQKNRALAFILRGLIKRGDTAKLRDFIRRNRNLSVFFLGLPSYWQLNYLLQVVEIRDRKRKEIAKTENELESDRRLLEKFGGPLQPENEAKPEPTPVPAPRPMPQPVPTPPVPAPQPIPQPVPTPEPALPPGILPNTPQANAVTGPQAKIEAGYGSQVASINGANPYPRGPNGQLHNCTWYAWQAVHDASGGTISLPGMGNATDWLAHAQNQINSGNSAFRSINADPVKGSVIWMGGHVAFVESVQYDQNGFIKSMTMSDEHWGTPYKWNDLRQVSTSNPNVQRYTYTLTYDWFAKNYHKNGWRSINFNYPA